MGQVYTRILGVAAYDSEKVQSTNLLVLKLEKNSIGTDMPSKDPLLPIRMRLRGS